MNTKSKSLLEQVHDTRAGIAALKVEHRTLINQKRSRSEVEAIATRAIDALAAEGNSTLASAIAATANGSALSPFHMRNGGPNTTLNIGPMLVAIVGAKVAKAALMAHVNNVPIGLDHAARIERLATLASEILTLERAEEALIGQAEFEGQRIDRRADANPAVVLEMHQ